jgi:hypothetical protein
MAHVGRRRAVQCGPVVEMAHLDEEERGRGAGVPAWAERPSRAGRFYEN